jgi:hypothetical protein
LEQSPALISADAQPVATLVADLVALAQGQLEAEHLRMLVCLSANEVIERLKPSLGQLGGALLADDTVRLKALAVGDALHLIVFGEIVEKVRAMTSSILVGLGNAKPSRTLSSMRLTYSALEQPHEPG